MASAKPQSNVKCYTAEEIGETVGLSLDQAKDEVRRISEDIPKSTKVQFSDDYQPPVYNIWSQQKIAEHSGVSRQYVHKVLSTNKSESDSLVDAPPTLQSRTDKADFRKLPVELQEQVAAKEVSLNAAAITKEQARKAAITEAKANPLLNVGPPTKEEKANLGNSNNTIGNTNEYLLRRLARDQPELLDKIESGELTVNQAAIQAT